MNKLITLILGTTLLVGCANEQLENLPVAANHDRDLLLTRDEFLELMQELAPAPDFTPDPNQLNPRELLDQRLQEQVELGPLVSISANSSVDLKDLLLGLARQAERDIEIDPRITGGVMLAVRQRPFLKVIERIADLANLRFEIIDGVLRIELDEPYNHSYHLNLLNLQRNSNGTVSTSTNVLQGGSDSGGGGNGSSNSVETSTKADIWGEIEASISHLLRSEAPERLSSGGAAFGGAIIANNGDDIVGTMNGGDAASLDAGSEASLINAQLAAAEALLANDVQATEVEDTTEAEASEDEETVLNYTIDRSAGLINIYGTERQHEAVTTYLDRLRQNMLAQVLIEAKVLEVSLDESFETGINWRAVFDKVSIGAPLAGTLTPVPGPFNALSTAASDVFSVALDSNDIEGVISLIETFGTVRTLSSPRVTVMQNNTAVLKVAENRVFFRLDVEREEQEDGDDLITVSSEINTVPVGVVITVQPSIDLDRQSIMMALRPTITRIASMIDDPAVAIASNNTVRSQIPVVAVQEIDSVVEVETGKTVVMGGLMEENGQAADQGVPGAAELPFLGWLFKSRQEAKRQSELVIFLRATIVKESVLPPKDRQLLDDFTSDPRPYGAPSLGF